jgi:uncharacterized protein
MIQLKISAALLKNEGKIEKSVEVYECGGLEGLVKRQQIAVFYEASIAGEEYLLRGTVSGMLKLSCGKCLKDFDFPLSSVEFVQSFEASTAEIDVDDEIRQAVLLSIPLHPACSDVCKGLCPQCGANLNDATCNCHDTQPQDSRWENLKKLL